MWGDLNLQKENLSFQITGLGLSQDCMVNKEAFFTRPKMLITLKEKSFENIVGIGENAGDQHLLLFLQCFLPC